jgi:hypothetical protein
VPLRLRDAQPLAVAEAQCEREPPGVLLRAPEPVGRALPDKLAHPDAEPDPDAEPLPEALGELDDDDDGERDAVAHCEALPLPLSEL